LTLYNPKYIIITDNDGGTKYVSPKRPDQIWTLPSLLHKGQFACFARGTATETWSLAHTSILYRSYECMQPSL